MTALVVFGVILLVLIVWFVGVFNKLVALKNRSFIRRLTPRSCSPVIRMVYFVDDRDTMSHYRS